MSIKKKAARKESRNSQRQFKRDRYKIKIIINSTFVSLCLRETMFTYMLMHTHRLRRQERDDWTAPGVQIPLNDYKQTNEYRRSLLMDCILSTRSPEGTQSHTVIALMQKKKKKKIPVLAADNMRHQQSDPIKSSRLLSEFCVSIPPL